MDGVVQFRSAAELGTAERADERPVPATCDRNGCDCRRRADGPDQREDLVLVEQLDGLDRRAVGIVAVIAADQLEPAAVDAALGVDLFEGGENALAHPLP